MAKPRTARHLFVSLAAAAAAPQVLNGGTMPSADGTGDTAAITFADPSLGVPSVLFFMGANGMGKTTTVGKVASRLREDGGQKVLLAAADTFRCDRESGMFRSLRRWQR